jgi:hypothetical protein
VASVEGGAGDLGLIARAAGGSEEGQPADGPADEMALTPAAADSIASITWCSAASMLC